MHDLIDRIVPGGGSGPRRAPILVAAGVLFAAVFLLRLLIENPEHVVTLLYALPIALVAVGLGTALGPRRRRARAGALRALGPLDVGQRPERARLRGPRRRVLRPRRAHRRARRPRPEGLGGAGALLGAVDGPALHRRLRRPLRAAEPGLGADARLDTRGAPGAAVPRLRPPRGPRADGGRGGQPHGRGPRDAPLREPLPLQGRQLPHDRLERHVEPRRGADLRAAPGTPPRPSAPRPSCAARRGSSTRSREPAEHGLRQGRRGAAVRALQPRRRGAARAHRATT